MEYDVYSPSYTAPSGKLMPISRVNDVPVSAKEALLILNRQRHFQRDVQAQELPHEGEVILYISSCRFTVGSNIGDPCSRLLVAARPHSVKNGVYYGYMGYMLAKRSIRL